MLVDDITNRRQQLHRSLDELCALGNRLRKRAETESRDKLLVDAYALVCEVARIVVKEHPTVRRTQIQAAIELDKGRIVEMQNGEGKTLAATMPAYLNSLKEGHSVHIATYNDYLAHRDARWMGPIYDTLGLTIGIIDSKKSYRLQRTSAPSSELLVEQEAETDYNLTESECTRASAYECDIVYGTYKQFALDYLRDNTVTREADRVQNNRLHFIILDEADSVLIENAHTPALVVETRAADAGRYRSLCRVANELQAPLHYNIISNQMSIEMTPIGIAKAELMLRQEDLLTGQLYSIDSPAIASQLIQALRVKEFYHRDLQYIIRDGSVKPLNTITGRTVRRRSIFQGVFSKR